MELFRYRELTPEKRSFRLVCLARQRKRSEERTEDRFDDQSESPISCTIVHADLEKAPAYTALSYAWGDPTNLRNIHVGGKQVSITTNLEEALRHLQHVDEETLIWADALCIDQENVAEKNEQVPQMKDIYARANHVIAWLGPAREDGEIAMKWIKEYGGRAHDLGIGTTRTLRLTNLLETRMNRSQPSFDGPLEDFMSDLEAEFSPSSATFHQLLPALGTFVARSYWCRVWVIQELVFARRLRFQCGELSSSEDEMNHALRLIRNFRMYSLRYTAPMEARLTSDSEEAESRNFATIEPCFAVDIVKTRRARTQPNLIYLLRMHRRSDATDPRDKVFALYGISCDAQALGLVADYGKTCLAAYTDVARRLLAGGYLEILSLAVPDTLGNDFPSWVPDWSIKRSRQMLQERGLDRRSDEGGRTMLEPNFSAAGDVFEEPQFSVDKAGHELLRLSAHCIGTIKDVGEAWTTNGWAQWLQELERVSVACADAFASDSERLRRVYRCAVADQATRDLARKPRLSPESVERIKNALASITSGEVTPEALVDAGLWDYNAQMVLIAQKRRPIQISDRWIGLGTSEAQPGDRVYLVAGAGVPYICRGRPDNTMRLVGEAYVDGVMDGELANRLQTPESIVLE
jgi:hypothetical protein